MPTADYTFDGVNRLVKLNNTGSISVEDMFSRWKEWVLTSDNSKYVQAFRSVGGDPLTETSNLGSTYFLTNGWLLQPFTSSYNLTVNGNLYAEYLSGSVYVPQDPISQPSGSYKILVKMNVSNLIDTVLVESTLTEALTTKIVELWKIHGLDIANPLTVNQTSRTAGDIDQTINYNSGSNETVVTRI
jgi:hypothetical protein